MQPSQLIDLASTMIKLPSLTGGEHALSDWTHAWCGAAGFAAVHRLKVPEAADTIVATVDNGAGPAMMFNFHLDTFSVPAGWPRDPYQPWVEGNRLYGMGAHDMKGGGAAVLAAIETLLAARDSWRGRLIFAATTDEEAWSRGAHAVIESKLAEGAAYCLIPEPTVPGTLRVGARGRHVIRLRFTGVRANAAYNDSGINPIADAANVTNRLCGAHGIALGQHPLDATGGTLNVVGFKSGGTDILWPETADVWLDHSLPPGHSVEQTVAGIRALVETAGIRGKCDLFWDERPTPAPRSFVNPPDGLFARTVAECLARASGREIRPVLGRSVCDANHFHAFGGIPSIVCGPSGGNTSEACEWVDIDSMLAVARTYVDVTQRLLAPDARS